MNNTKKIKLTQYSSGAGWACKLSAEDLTQVLSKLNSISNSNNNSGFENFDDCSIYKINDKQSIIQSVDFFTPIVDDPYTFGLISAANSISDIYAMGGKPLFALNIVAFPSDDLPLDILSEILRGGLDKCKEANINILGGHSIKDKTPKYGLAVTGLIENDLILKNNTPNESDVLLLTKPLGSGILTTAIKKSEITYNQLFITLNVENLISSILFLKTNEKCKFKQLIEITAVDYPEREKRFKIVYLICIYKKLI